MSWEANVLFCFIKWFHHYIEFDRICVTITKKKTMAMANLSPHLLVRIVYCVLHVLVALYTLYWWMYVEKTNCMCPLSRHFAVGSFFAHMYKCTGHCLQTMCILVYIEIINKKLKWPCSYQANTKKILHTFDDTFCSIQKKNKQLINNDVPCYIGCNISIFIQIMDKIALCMWYMLSMDEQ